MSKIELPADVQAQIIKEAQAFACVGPDEGADHYYNVDYEIGHKAAATAWAEKCHFLEQRASRLFVALEFIANAPAPANEREYISWFLTAKNIAGGAVANWNAETEIAAWNAGKKEGGV